MSESSHAPTLLAKRLTRIATRMIEMVESLDLDASIGEAEIFALADQFGRTALEGFLARFDIPQDRVMIDGAEHYRIDRKPKSYRSTRGEVTVERNVYRKLGVRRRATMTGRP